MENRVQILSPAHKNISSKTVGIDCLYQFKKE